MSPPKDRLPQFFIQKVGNRGTSHPFHARLLLGMLELRDHVVGSDAASPQVQAKRMAFDVKYTPVVQELEGILNDAEELIRLWEGHEHAVVSGEGTKRQRDAISLPPSVDPQLNSLFQAITAAGRRGLGKLQDLVALFQINIGFLFQKQSAFDTGAAALGSDDPDLAGYLRNVRAGWSSDFVELRNKIEHGGWVLPETKYEATSDAVRIQEPVVEGVPVTQYCRKLVNRIILFVENTVAYVLQLYMNDFIVLVEIPPASRDVENAARFRVMPYLENVTRWLLTYNETTDFLP